MPKRGSMKHLFIFLTLPFFLCADQSNLENIEISEEYATFFEDETVVIERKGHQWKSMYFIHSQDCPCLKSKAYIPGIY